MGWCFAFINKRLAKIFFEEKRNEMMIMGHCYVSPEEYKTKKEQLWIKKDTKELQFSYRSGVYRNKNGEIFPSESKRLKEKLSDSHAPIA